MSGCRVLDHPCVMASDRLDRGKILLRHLMELPDRRDPMLVKQLLAVDTDMFQPGEAVLLPSRRLPAEAAVRLCRPPTSSGPISNAGPQGGDRFRCLLLPSAVAGQGERLFGLPVSDEPQERQQRAAGGRPAGAGPPR